MANQQKIKNLMQKKARLDMLENYKIETIEVNVIQVRYEYMKDYDLGDTCAVYIDDWNRCIMRESSRFRKLIKTIW